MKPNAFTLLEMLLVLSISLTMISLTIFPISNSLSAFNEKLLLEEMKASIYYAQLYAITSSQDTTISFTPIDNKLSASTVNNTLFTVPLSPIIKLNQKKAEKFRFSSLDGSINRFTTIHFTGSSKNYQLIFQIGKGRFRFEQD
ncbi:competence type IV pilus minor pilin ComGD [Listeria seeligeri]|uniref:competence type IV pilus minor pilin ComGD n=1 Tax=Listeria seeligeri TaxID=1640 RepID=UPI00162AF081|nr:competence type IV pilus minor pilin ComGD [Listeria seeligeri]MBC1423819.1 type II secretion system protein [Listeria seeligeri]MBC1444614.1 type II secretion system protein [Listeria seeligeri]MBC1534414.1 type II secretion system protein [Listeria seeligeri]MBC1538455.1 type II secretion system protein [Listeria seeligeri]MBC1540497.1 type II secretion system protein [Listeria seeligeri]